MRDKFKDKGLLIYSVILASLFLLICTKSSPLYPINDWVDSNAFFTMGKGMIQGDVLYKDLFEQKGPLLYFIHGLASLISYKSFFGVYIFEVIFFSILLYYANKILNLYFDRKYSYIGIPIIAFVILNLINFSHGDSAEEFVIPLLMISLYYLIKYFKEDSNEELNMKMVFKNGMLAGCVLWIKYSLLGFWIGWMMVIFFYEVSQKRIKEGLKGCFIFLSGMFASTIPWIIYFGYNRAIKEWIESYIIVNLNSYSVDYTFIEKVKFIIKNISNGITVNKLYGIVLILGIIYCLFTKELIKKKCGRVAIIIVIMTTAILAYCGGRGYSYYFLIMAPFVILGIIPILNIFKKIFDTKTKYFILTLGIVLSSIFLLITMDINHNVAFMKVKKEELIQYKYAKIIEETQNATLLNYGSLDNGLYLTTGIAPKFKHFEKQNISYEKYKENIDKQDEYIENGIPDYVLVRHQKTGIEYKEKKGLSKNYKLIAKEEQKFSGFRFEYRLYRKK